MSSTLSLWSTLDNGPNAGFLLCICYIYATNVADNHFHETVKLIVHDILATLTVRHPDLQRYMYKVVSRSFLLLPHLRL